MGGFKRTVTVSYGFVQSVVDLSSSKAKTEDDLVQVCTAGGHAPTKPKWDPFCPACNSTVGRGTLAKASEVAKDQFVVMTQDEVAALKSDDEQYKGKLALTAHDAAEVEGKVMPNGTTYFLAPNPKDQFFGLLRQMIVDNPDLAFMGLYTVTSRASLYRVRPFGDVLVAEQMLRPEETLQAPAYTPTPIPQQMLDMAQQVARGFVAPFDPAAYADTYKTRLAEALGVRQSEPGADLPTATPVAGADPMAAMAALMAAAISAPPAAGNGSDAAPVVEQKAAPKRTRKKAS